MITGAAGGHELDDQQGVPRRMWRPPMIVDTIPVGLFRARPVAQGSQVSRGAALPRVGEHHHQRGVSGAPSSLS